MKVFLTGGGTMGPVTPLMALAEVWRERDPAVEIVWMITPKGPEGAVLTPRGERVIPVAVPKLDRTRPWLWPTLLWRIPLSAYRAWKLLKAEKPDVIISAGAYVSTPFVVLGRFLGAKTIIHQLDAQVGLANKLMAPFARHIGVTWPQSASAFSAKKTAVLGAMVRLELLHGDARLGESHFNLRPHLPTVLVLGGGTGATSVNTAIAAIAPDLIETCNIIHLTGKGKKISVKELGKGYWQGEFLDAGLADALAVADLVVCRAGMGTIIELVALHKASILLPLPGHQELNARAVVAAGAGDMLPTFTPQMLYQAIRKLLQDELRRKEMEERVGALFPLTAAEEIVRLSCE